MEFPTEPHVEPRAGRDGWTGTIVYGENAQQQVRPYELLSVDPDRGHFRVDEKNSIAIDSCF